MKTYTEVPKTVITERLEHLGYTKKNANHLYDLYAKWNKIASLVDYIQTKESIRDNHLSSGHDALHS